LGTLDTVELTSDEITVATWLRAIEWSKWPTFLSQPLLPFLFAVFSPWRVCVAVVLATWFWLPFRYSFASYRLATIGCLWVRLKWPAIAVMTGYQIYHSNWYLAGATVLSPLITMALSPLSGTSQIGLIQHNLMRNVGFDPSDSVKNDFLDSLKVMGRGAGF
jgi:hypothetical protein